MPSSRLGLRVAALHFLAQVYRQSGSPCLRRDRYESLLSRSLHLNGTGARLLVRYTLASETRADAGSTRVAVRLVRR